MRYIPDPRTDVSSRYDVHTRDPVKVTYSRSCGHPGEPVPYRYMDKRSESMDRFYGTCCGLCGRILSRTKLE